MENIIKEGRTRREFLKGAGAVVAGGVVVGVVGSQLSCEELPGVGAADWWTADSDPLTLAPEAEAYIVFDTQKCAGCNSCMMSCSLVHEGVLNLSLGRMQRTLNLHGRFPFEVAMQVCRQCVYPACIEACPSGAFHTDAANGNTRTIDEGVCSDYQDSIAPDICQLCMEACPYVPSMAVWNHTKGVAMVCDLCKDAPFYGEDGGVDGKQACIENCTNRAISLVKGVPSQFDNDGYNRNLRTEYWAAMNTRLDRLPISFIRYDQSL